MKIAIKRTDGRVSIMQIDDIEIEEGQENQNPDELMEAALDKAINDWKGVHIDEYVSHRVIASSAIPDDRTFRDAWTDDDVETETIDVDMSKARDIQMDVIRGMRDKKLAELDISYMQADEQGDDNLKTQIAQQKQILRDLPVAYDLTVATTPDELKQMIPDEVKEQ